MITGRELGHVAKIPPINKILEVWPVPVTLTVSVSIFCSVFMSFGGVIEWNHVNRSFNLHAI